MHKIKRSIIGTILILSMLISCVGCASKNVACHVTIFAAKSLNMVMDELILEYGREHPEISFSTNYDSSGTLMVQIEERAECDIFFSAAESQMDTLEAEGFLANDTRQNVVNNQVCVVTYKGSGTKVTGIENLVDAKSLALASGSVPVGKYTRVALGKLGLISEAEDYSKVTTAEISEALGNLEINECANVGAVAAAVSEGANEVGTVYYSDYMGFEDKLEILEVVPYELTGNVIYPVAQIDNKKATDREKKAALDFILFLKSEKAQKIFKKYYFDTQSSS